MKMDIEYLLHYFLFPEGVLMSGPLGVSLSATGDLQ